MRLKMIFIHRSIVILFLGLLCLNCKSQNDLTLELVKASSRNPSKEGLTLKIKITNNSLKNYYIAHLNPVTNLHFFSHQRTDISAEIWGEFYYAQQVPVPSDSMKTKHVYEDSHVFYSCAINEDFNRIKSIHGDNISKEDEKELMEMLSIKYDLVTLVKKGNFHEEEFTFYLDCNSLKSIVFCYDYQDIYGDVEKKFLHKKNGKAYLLNNIPLKKVCGYSLFQGSLTDSLTF